MAGPEITTMGCYRCQPASTGGGLCDGCRITLLGEQVAQLTLEVRDLRAVVREVRPPVAREQMSFHSEAGDAYRAAVRRADERELECQRAVS